MTTEHRLHSRRDDLAGEHFASFLELYNRVFEVKRADTDALRAESHRVRYQVYCVENQFEKAEDNPNELEVDKFDEKAIHSVLIHRHSGLVVGSVRVILPDRNAPRHSLPIHEICDIASLDPTTDPLRVAEISRFCISKKIRKRIGDTSQYVGIYNSEVTYKDCVKADELTKRAISYAAVGLIKAAIEIGQEHQIRYYYAAMEPYLIRSLRMMGVPSTKLGPTVHYHGERQPTRLSTIETFEHSKTNNPDTWDVISDGGRLHDIESRAIADAMGKN